MKRIIYMLLLGVLPFIGYSQVTNVWGVMQYTDIAPLAPPTTGAKIAYRMLDNSVYYWNGSAWVKIGTGYVQISDTSAMLSKYIERGDTAAMLTNYPSTAGYGLLKTGKTLRVDSSTVATRYYVGTNPTTIANTRIAVSNGSNLVGYSGWTYDNVTGIHSNIFSAGSTLRMYSGVTNSGSPQIELGNAINPAKAGIIRGTVVGASDWVNLDFINNSETYLRMLVASGGTRAYTRATKPFVVNDTMGITGASLNTGNKYLYFNGNGGGYIGNAAIIGVVGGVSSRINAVGIAINNTGAGAWGAATTADFALYVNNNKNVLIGTTTDVSTSIFTARSNTKSSSPFPLHTTVQSNAITGVNGNFEYITDGIGPALSWYNGTLKAYAMESTFARSGRAGRIFFSNANLQATEADGLTFSSNSIQSIGTTLNFLTSTSSGAAGMYAASSGQGNIDFSLSGIRRVTFGSQNRNSTYSFELGTLVNGAATVGKSAFLISGGGVFVPSSGSAELNIFEITSQIQRTGTYSGVVNSVKINPVITGDAPSSTTYTLRALETVRGDTYLGSTYGVVGIRTAPDPAYEIRVGGDGYFEDSLRLTTTPAHTSITGLLTRDATGWVGAASLAGGLSYSGGVLTGANIYTANGSLPGLRTITYSGTSSNNLVIQGTNNAKVFSNEFESSNTNMYTRDRRDQYYYPGTGYDARYTMTSQNYSGTRLDLDQDDNFNNTFGSNKNGYMLRRTRYNTGNNQVFSSFLNGVDSVSGSVGAVMKFRSQTGTATPWYHWAGFVNVDGFGGQLSTDERYIAYSPSFKVQTQKHFTNTYFDWIKVEGIDTDTTGNRVSFYNGKLPIPNERPETWRSYAIGYNNNTPTLMQFARDTFVEDVTLFSVGTLMNSCQELTITSSMTGTAPTHQEIRFPDAANELRGKKIIVFSRRKDASIYVPQIKVVGGVSRLYFTATPGIGGADPSDQSVLSLDDVTWPEIGTYEFTCLKIDSSNYRWVLKQR